MAGTFGGSINTVNTPGRVAMAVSSATRAGGSGRFCTSVPSRGGTEMFGTVVGGTVVVGALGTDGEGAVVVVVVVGGGGGGDVISTLAASTSATGPSLPAASETEFSTSVASTVPSVEQVTLTVTDAPDEADGVKAQSAAVPALMKSSATMPLTLSEKVSV